MQKPVTETWVTPMRRPVSGIHTACLVHIYPTGMAMGQRYPLAEKPIVIGRGDDCDIRITDHSVSRKHARIETTAESICVADLGSTNGTFINDRAIRATEALHDGDYLRIGNCIYRFLAGGNIEAEYHEEIYRLTIIDALTQTHNQRSLMEFLDRELVRSNRHGRPLAFIMFDVDFFKNVNDQLGHLAGDFALREISNLIRGTIRREDLFARYGGEEFAIVLVESGVSEARDVAERVRAIIGNHVFRFEDAEFRLTISAGVSTTAGDEGLTPREMVKRADEKMYEAKSAGRDRIAI